jgi:hypothetical protein
MTKEGSWTALERLVLLRASRTMLPLLAELMERPIEEVVSKYHELQAIYEAELEEKAQSLMEMGLEEDEAFLKAAEEEKTVFKKIRIME